MACALNISLALASESLSLLKPLKEYRGAEVIKSDLIKNTEYILPLGNLKRLGRGWQPSNSILLQGDRVMSLYKFGRSMELNRIYEHYQEQLLVKATVLYECSGRKCGSSNVWANSFFKEYQLYGPDDNQFLLVTHDKSNGLYQILYMNRRGAGDIIVYIDRVQLRESAADDKKNIAFQTEVLNTTKIRLYLESQPSNEKYIALVSANKQLSANAAISQAGDHINEIKGDLGVRLSSRIRFINIASFGQIEFGEELITLIKD